VEAANRFEDEPVIIETVSEPVLEDFKSIETFAENF
jgi:hypothetical protein